MDSKEFNKTLLRLKQAELFDDAYQLSAQLLGYTDDQIADCDFMNPFAVYQNSSRIRDVINNYADTKTNYFVCGKWIIILDSKLANEIYDEVENDGLFPCTGERITYSWLIKREEEQLKF